MVFLSVLYFLSHFPLKSGLRNRASFAPETDCMCQGKLNDATYMVLSLPRTETAVPLPSPRLAGPPEVHFHLGVPVGISFPGGGCQKKKVQSVGMGMNYDPSKFGGHRTPASLIPPGPSTSLPHLHRPSWREGTSTPTVPPTRCTATYRTSACRACQREWFVEDPMDVPLLGTELQRSGRN